MVQNKPGSGNPPEGHGPGPGGPPPGPPKPQFPLGYNGKILRVNLTTKTITTEALKEEMCRKYLGGAGFVAYYLWNELKPGIDPLGPENKLIFALGPLTGHILPGASRNCIGAKSPLAKGIAKSEVGGFWMAEFKRAGYDAVIFEGKAEKPVYLWVHDGEVEIRDAGYLWGKETKETQDAIRAELGDEKIHVAMIGPGGENLVRFACIMEGCFDAAGRGGLGAVMGSKNLKAVAARGHTLPPVADSDLIKGVRQQMTHPYPQSEFGTGGGIQMIGGEASGDLPIRNFRDGVFPEVKDINATVLRDTVRTGMEGCFACMVRCKKIVKIEEPYKVDPAYGGPEYETLASIGSNCGVKDIKAICRGNQLLNAYSLDSISAGSAISFAIECYERGLLTKKDTGGLELKWGDADLMLKLIDMIARREGFGDFLAEGTARMSEKIGKGSKAFALHVKGLEPGMHDPRVGSALALTYMTAANGADHCHAEPDGLLAVPPIFAMYHPFGLNEPVKQNDLGTYKVAVYKASEIRAVLNDCLVACHFPSINFQQMVDLLKGLTGWDTGTVELVRIGERVLTLMRMFNLREGLTAEDDVLPERLLGPTTNGALAKFQADRAGYDRMRKYFYTLMNWDSNGVPLPEKVEDLGLK